MVDDARFVHVGMGHLVQAARVIAVMKPGTATTKRYIALAKKREAFIDATVGRGMKSVLLMDDGTVIAVMVKSRTLRDRFNGHGFAVGDKNEDGIYYEEDADDAEGEEEEEAEEVGLDEDVSDGARPRLPDELYVG